MIKDCCHWIFNFSNHLSNFYKFYCFSNSLGHYFILFYFMYVLSCLYFISFKIGNLVNFKSAFDYSCISNFYRFVSDDSCSWCPFSLCDLLFWLYTHYSQKLFVEFLWVFGPKSFPLKRIFIYFCLVSLGNTSLGLP